MNAVDILRYRLAELTEMQRRAQSVEQLVRLQEQRMSVVVRLIDADAEDGLNSGEKL